MIWIPIKRVGLNPDHSMGGRRGGYEFREMDEHAVLFRMFGNPAESV
jgi:hypothetical protein